MGVFTTTATSETRSLICENLVLHNLTTVTHTPNRPNIRYCIMKVPTSDLRKDFQWLLHKLQEEGKEAPHVTVYCQRLTDCTELYGIFEDGMKDRDKGTLPNERLYTMYHSQTDDCIKDHVHQSFSQTNGTVRVIFATGRNIRYFINAFIRTV